MNLSYLTRHLTDFHEIQVGFRHHEALFNYFLPTVNMSNRRNSRVRYVYKKCRFTAQWPPCQVANCQVYDMKWQHCWTPGLSLSLTLPQSSVYAGYY